MATNNDSFRALEPDDEVPAYLKRALVSEIDLIRDTMQVVELFTDGLFGAVVMCLPENTDTQPN